MAKSTIHRARVLVAGYFAGVGLKVDEVVSGTEDQIKQLVGQGAADDHTKAVAYALSVNGNRVIDISGEAKAAEEAAAAEAAQKLQEAQAAVQAAEEALVAAKTDEEKAVAQQNLDAAKAALAELV